MRDWMPLSSVTVRQILVPIQRDWCMGFRCLTAGFMTAKNHLFISARMIHLSVFVRKWKTDILNPWFRRIFWIIHTVPSWRQHQRLDLLRSRIVRRLKNAGNISTRFLRKKKKTLCTRPKNWSVIRKNRHQKKIWKRFRYCPAKTSERKHFHFPILRKT